MPFLEEKFNLNIYSMEHEEWTKIVISDELFQQITEKFGLRYRFEDYKIDVVLAGCANLIYEQYDDRFWPLERLVLVEHESFIENVIEELYKLLYWRAPLKVFISYPSQSSKKSIDDYMKTFAEIIKRSNKWFPENSETQYLFIIGQMNESRKGLKWQAYVIDTEGNIELLTE
ncbi:MAG: hypothetical protein Q6363_002965 [Candidatus Njordarchaeota archaeon]